MITHKKPPLLVHGHHGMGDNLHQRAFVRQLMATHEVWLESSWASLYYDLVADGLKLLPKSTRLRTQAKNLERERGLFSTETVPRDTLSVQLRYSRGLVQRERSVLGAMFASTRFPMNVTDFRFPVPEEWKERARAIVGRNVSKPIMIYRPLVLRTEWNNAARNPEVADYAAVFNAIREPFHVVSVADLVPGVEWSVSLPVRLDQEFHNGELPFEALAGLFAISSLVYSSPGFGVVLAQAVSTPIVSVFGHYERAYSFSIGAALTPSCFVEPIIPVDNFKHDSAVPKNIARGPAIDRIQGFIAAQGILHDRKHIGTG